MIQDLETTLSETKWYDYRCFSSERCNMEFVKEWIAAHNTFQDWHKIDVRFDANGEEYLPAMKWGSYQEIAADLETMPLVVNLRRCADRNCIPYDRFWAIAFTVLADTCEWRDDFQAIGTMVKSSIVDAYQEEAKLTIKLSTSPEMFPANFKGKKHQVEYFEYIERETKARHPDDWKARLELMWARGSYHYVLNHPVN